MGSTRLNLLSKHEDAHDDALWCTTWVPNQNQCITGSVDECVKVWAVQDELPYVENSHTYTSHTLGVVSVTVDPTGTFAASSALDSFIRVWNLQVNVAIETGILPAPPGHAPNAAGVMPSSTTYWECTASGASESDICAGYTQPCMFLLWCHDSTFISLQDSSTKAVIETPPSETWQIKFMPQSDSLMLAAAGGSSSKVVLWDVVETQPRGHLGIPSVRTCP